MYELWYIHSNETYINGDKHAVMIEFELSSIRDALLDLRKSSAKERIPLETNMLLVLGWG